MDNQTALTAKPLPIAKAKAGLARLVKEGVITPERAKLIDFRELTPQEIAHAETLGPLARRSRT